MAWTPPRTWTTSQLVTAADLNTDLRDNLNYLYDRANTDTAAVTGLISTNSTSYTQTGSISVTLTTIGKPGTQVAAITHRPQGYFVIHVEGGAGDRTPIINGKQIGTQATALQDHDVIEVAGVKMEFFMD
jgi:hypothetical protein